MSYNDVYPKTNEIAAEIVKDGLSEDDLTAIKKLEEDDLWS